MGNLFIGFPVPRAKIADMIDGAAPPLEHKTQHQTGGSDEIDVTGLVGAGGLTLPFSDFLYNTAFPSLTGMKEQVSGGGTIFLSDGGCQLYTDVASGDRARLYKQQALPPIPLTWEKNRQFNTKVSFYADGSPDRYLYIGTGYPMTGHGFGFIVENGLFKTISNNATTPEEYTIADWSAGSFFEEKILRAHRTASDSIKFYVDGSLVYTSTTKIPTGTNQAPYLFYIDILLTASASYTEMYIANYDFWQEA